MKLHISHGASCPGGPDWFVVKPLDGETETSVAGTPITHAMAVGSLLNAGRAVYEVDLDGKTVIRLANPDQQARPENWHVEGFWRLGRAAQRRHLLDAHQVNAPRPGGTDLIALHRQAHAAGHDDGNRIDVYGIANPEVD